MTPINVHIRELKHARVLSHGRQLEVNILQAKTVGLFQIFKVIVSKAQRDLKYKCGSVKTSETGKQYTSGVRLCLKNVACLNSLLT